MLKNIITEAEKRQMINDIETVEDRLDNLKDNAKKAGYIIKRKPAINFGREVYVKVYYENIDYLDKEGKIKGVEGLILKLFKFVEKGSNVLVVREENGTKRPASLTDLANDLGIDRGNLSKNMTKLQKAGVLYIGETESATNFLSNQKTYTMSPFIVFKGVIGEKVNKTLIRLFKTKKSEKYPRQILKNVEEA